MRNMWDAAWPPKTDPGEVVAAGYIGGADASHVWTSAEWKRVLAFPTVAWALPIYVASNPFDAARGSNDAHEALAMADHLGVPTGVAIALDVEQGVAREAAATGYVGAWCAAIEAGGNHALVYTSRASGGLFAGLPLWLAEWDNNPHLIEGTMATQYASPVTDKRLAVDLSLVADALSLWPVKETPGGKPLLDKPCSDSWRNPDGGYTLVAEDGGVFVFGDRRYFHGSLPHSGVTPDAPITSAFPSHDYGGYTLVGADGGVFVFGNAQFHGSIPSALAKKNASAEPMHAFHSDAPAPELVPVTSTNADPAG